MNSRDTNGQPRAARRGFSALEILIVVIILGILAGLIVPTLQTRAAQARIRAANRDLKEIQEALARVAVDSRYLVPLHILDDVWTDDASIGWSYANDCIYQEDNNPNVAAGRQGLFFIDTKTGDFLPAAENQRMFDRLIGVDGGQALDADRARRAMDRFAFYPPYVSWNRDQDRDDIQDDPWGNPYLFFTPEGMVYDYDSRDPNTRKIQHRVIEGWDYTDFSEVGGGSPPSSADCTVFDRFVVLSMGPNGVPGDDIGTADYNIFGMGDDLFVFFH